MSDSGTIDEAAEDVAYRMEMRRRRAEMQQQSQQVIQPTRINNQVSTVRGRIYLSGADDQQQVENGESAEERISLKVSNIEARPAHSIITTMPVGQICNLFESRLSVKEIQFSHEAAKYIYTKQGPPAIEDDDSEDEE